MAMPTALSCDLFQKILCSLIYSPCILYRNLDRISRKSVVIPFIRNTFLNLTRRQHRFLCLKQTIIAEWQGAREEEKFVAKPMQSNTNLFLINGIIPFIFDMYPYRSCAAIERVHRVELGKTGHCF